ncbi:MAG: HAMP domain-containing sensor histidine kinase [Pseudomonadota bacterium]
MDAAPPNIAINPPVQALPTTVTQPLLRSSGSLGRRMIGIAAAWILLLLVIGGLTLERVIGQAITTNFDDNIEYLLTAMIRASEVGPDSNVRLIEPLGEQRFFEPYSGLYWQISGTGNEPERSRSLWDRTLDDGTSHSDEHVHRRDSVQFTDEPLRIVERDVVLPGSPIIWRFQVAQSRSALDTQMRTVRRTIVRSFAILALGLIILAALQTVYGLWPLRRIRRGIAALKEGDRSLLSEPMPVEVLPMVQELDGLITHNERQAEEARRHAGNLAHALKTPLTVIMNAASANDPDLADLVTRESATMRRQVDHHLARARAVGRRGQTQLRAAVWGSIEGVERAVACLYPDTRFDADGPRDVMVKIERQDLDEILGNLMENAAKYGGGSVFVTVSRDGDTVQLLVEDDGPGIAEADRSRLFDRGVRLDTSKPGTGLGLAIVRDVAEIYGGSVTLESSEDMGGLAVRLILPGA